MTSAIRVSKRHILRVVLMVTVAASMGCMGQRGTRTLYPVVCSHEMSGEECPGKLAASPREFVAADFATQRVVHLDALGPVVLFGCEVFSADEWACSDPRRTSVKTPNVTHDGRREIWISRGARPRMKDGTFFEEPTPRVRYVSGWTWLALYVKSGQGFMDGVDFATNLAVEYPMVTGVIAILVLWSLLSGLYHRLPRRTWKP